MRVIFVGVHNKEAVKGWSTLPPLCSSTMSGKLIDRIIKELPAEVTVLKTNLFNTLCLPPKEEFPKHRQLWVDAHNPSNNDLIILLGEIVRKEFFYNAPKMGLLAIPHPASVKSRDKKDRYVQLTCEFIGKHMKEQKIPYSFSWELSENDAAVNKLIDRLNFTTQDGFQDLIKDLKL